MAGESISSTFNAVLTKDTGIFSGLKDVYSVLSSGKKKEAFDIFKQNLFFVKGFCTVFIITLACVNYFLHKNLGMIESNPVQFALEAALFGVTAVLPFLAMAYLRNTVYDKSELIKISVVLFIVFFVLNYVLEISGIYRVSFQDTEKVFTGNTSGNFDFEKSVSRTSEIMVATIIVGSLVSLFIVSYYVADTSPEYVNFTYLPPIVLFIFEMLFVSIVSAASIFLFAYDRNDLSRKTLFEFLLLVLKFAVLHCLLQYSGYFRSVYKK